MPVWFPCTLGRDDNARDGNPHRRTQPPFAEGKSGPASRCSWGSGLGPGLGSRGAPGGAPCGWWGGLGRPLPPGPSPSVWGGILPPLFLCGGFGVALWSVGSCAFFGAGWVAWVLSGLVVFGWWVLVVFLSGGLVALLFGVRPSPPLGSGRVWFPLPELPSWQDKGTNNGSCARRLQYSVGDHMGSCPSRQYTVRDCRGSLGGSLREGRAA